MMRSVQRFWIIGLTSPLIYLVICLVLDRTALADRETGFWPMPEKVYGPLFTALAFVAMVSAPIVYLLKSKWAAAVSDATDEMASILETTLGRRFIVLFMICDTMAMTGLILFLIQGKLGAMLFFGLLGLLNYAAAYPGSPRDENAGL